LSSGCFKLIFNAFPSLLLKKDAMNNKLYLVLSKLPELSLIMCFTTLFENEKKKNTYTLKEKQTRP